VFNCRQRLYSGSVQNVFDLYRPDRGMEGFNPARGVNGHNEFFKVLCGYIACGGPIPRARSPIIYLKDS
jgi:hypothetical protein